MTEMVLPENITECHALIRQLLAIIQHGQREQAVLASKVADLEARLAQNSHNSSRSPSSDFGKNTAKQTLRPGVPKEAKSQGGQKDHKGKTLLKIETPMRLYNFVHLFVRVVNLCP